VNTIAAKPRRAISKWLDVAVFRVLVGYICWCPLEANFTRVSSVTRFVGLAIPAIVFIVFAVYLFISRPCFGLLGLKLSLISAGLIFAYMMTYIINGGIKGPVEISRFWIFRVILLLLICQVSYRLSRLGLFTLQTIAVCCVFVAVSLMASMLACLVLELEPQDSYDKITRLPTFTGMSISGYSLAFALPGIAVLKRQLLKYIFIGLTLVAITMTYRRGPMLCASLVITIIILFGYRDRLCIRILGTTIIIICVLLLIVNVGANTLSTRWIELYEGTSRGFSMRDEIYPTLTKGIINDMHCWLFGHGIGSTVLACDKSFGETVYAHNDWLEITYTTGLVGLVPFILLHILFVKVIWVFFQDRNNMLMISLVTYVLFLVAGLTAGVLYSNREAGLLFCILGSTCAFADNIRSEKLRRCRDFVPFVSTT